MNDGSILRQLILQIFLIGLNAIFACAEIAVITINDNKLAKMAEQGNKKAIRLVALTSQPARFLATIQVAITLSGFLGSAFAADNFSEKLVSWVISLGVNISPATLDAISVIVITLILSYFTLVFGELVPKRIAMKNAEKLALGLATTISIISTLFAPIVWCLTASTNGILRLLGIDPNAEEEQVTEEEIRMMVDVGSQKGTIDFDEKEMIQNVFEFDDLTASEIATHRTEISLLWLEESMDQWEQTIKHSRHSRYPICDGSADNVIGILNTKDYFRLSDKTRDNIMKKAVKAPYFVPEGVKADLLFSNMKKMREHLAVVLDEYGGMSGIVTMNDLLEQLVGDLDDEEELIELPDDIERIDSKTWKISGSALLSDVAEQLGVALPEDEYDTFGGLIFSTLGSVPDDGTQFEVEVAGLNVKVTKIKEHRIERAVVCLTREEMPADKE